MNRLAQGWSKADPPRTPPNWGWPAAVTQQAVVGDYPKGKTTQSEAEEILTSATAWWDASSFRQGDRWLRNKGQGGPVLDARLGSSIDPNTNDPLYLAPEDRGYVWLPGVSPSILTVPNEAAFAITGDIDLRAQAAFDVWGTTNQDVVTRWNGTYSYGMVVHNSKKVGIYWTADGVLGNNKSAFSTSVIPFAAGTTGWIRATLDVDNGAGQYAATFYTSLDGVNWTQLGNVVTGSTGVTSIFAGTSLVEVDRGSLIGAGPAKFYRIQILNGINGTLVLDIDCDAITSGGQSGFLARTGQIVTINRATSGRKTVAMPSKAMKKSDDACVYLAGSERAIINYNAVMNTTDIDVRVCCSLDSYSVQQGLVARWTGTIATESWEFLIQASGTLVGAWTDGVGAFSDTSTVTLVSAVPMGMPVWLRWTMKANNGAGGHTSTFYYSFDGSTWIPLGAAVTTAGTTTVASSVRAIEVGALGGASYAKGRFYRMQMLNGIDGSLIYDMDLSKVNRDPGIGTNSDIPLVVNGGSSTAYLAYNTANTGYRYLPEKWEAGRPVFLFGTDDYCEVTGPQSALQFGANDSMTLVFVMRRFSGYGADYANLISKNQASANEPIGWSIRKSAGTTGNVIFMTGDGNGAALSSGNVTGALNGSHEAIIAKFDRALRQSTIFTSGLQGTIAPNPKGNLASPYNVRLGCSAVGTAYYMDMEFMAAAVFRRVLSQREIDLICRYYGTVWS